MATRIGEKRTFSFPGLELDRNLLDELKGRKKVNLSDTIADTEPKVKKAALPPELGKTWDELVSDAAHLGKANSIEKIKENNFTLYAVLYFSKYKKYPEGSKNRMDWAVKEVYETAMKEARRQTLSGMDWKELMNQELTEEYKQLDREGYKEKFLKFYGVPPKFM